MKNPQLVVFPVPVLGWLLRSARHIHCEKTPDENGDDTMDHTASVFPLKPDGKFMGTISYGADEVGPARRTRLVR